MVSLGVIGHAGSSCGDSVGFLVDMEVLDVGGVVVVEVERATGDLHHRVHFPCRLVIRMN